MANLELFIKLLISILSLSSVIILTYAMFKIPIKENDKQIFMIGLLLGVTNFYFKILIHSPYHFLMLILTYFVSLLIARRYPILFVLIVTLAGMTSMAVFDSTISYIAIRTNLSSVEQMRNSFSHFLFFNTLTSILNLALAIVIMKLKLGFSFIIRRFKGKQAFTLSNCIWATLLIVGSFITHGIAMEDEVLPTYFVLLLVLLMVFIIAIIYTWRKNKQVVRDRYQNR